MFRTLTGALVLAMTACTTAADAPLFPTVFPEDSPEAAGILDFVNDPKVDLVTLDELAALDSRAATAIIAHRDGLDGRWGTEDDNLFDSLRELDDAEFVGPAAIYAMLETAWLHGWMEDHLMGFDGIGFAPAEARAILLVANEASFEVLDDDLALDRRAAQAIVDARPIDTMSELSELHYVGQVALERLLEASE